MVLSKNSDGQRIVERLLDENHFKNKNKVKYEKIKSKNGKKGQKGQKEKLNNPRNPLSLQINKISNQYDEFVSATPDYLSTQTYQQEQLQNPVLNSTIINSTPIQTDYYSIYNQLASNTLLSNVFNYNPIQINPYYSLISDPSPVYSTYSDVERSASPMYSPNYYSYPLSAPISYNGYTMPNNLGMAESPVKTKKLYKKKNSKKQALKDHLNHEQQIIAQLHKNINENKLNKIVGKKKSNKDQKEINRKNRKIASKNLKINTRPTQRVQSVFNREQIINNSIVKKAETRKENNPLFNSVNVFPKYTKQERKSSIQKGPSQQSIIPGISRNGPSGHLFDKSTKENSNIEFILINELVLTFLNNVYNGYNWSSKLTNSKTNRNISFLTKNNNDDSHEIISWKDGQTPGQKYSIASLLAMANSPIGSGSIATERRVNRKELYNYWAKMARKSMLENSKNESEKSPKEDESYIQRMIQNKFISKNNNKFNQVNKPLTKKTIGFSNEKETMDSFSTPSNHPLDKLSYLNGDTNINSNNKNNHPIAAKFIEYYNHQQNMIVPSNQVQSMIGRNIMELNKDNSEPIEKLLNSKDPNKLYDYLLNLNIESSKKTTSSSKNFTSADMLKPNYSSSSLNQQPNEHQYKSIATFTSPILYSIPVNISYDINPQYSINYSNTSLYHSSTENESDKNNKKGKKTKSSNIRKGQSEEISNNEIYKNSVLPQSFSNASLLSVASTASSSIPEMDFSNVRTHYDFIMPKALPKKSKELKSKEPKSNNQKGKSTLSQVQDINENDNSEPDYSLIDFMYNNNNNNNEKLSNKNGQDQTSNTSLVGYMFDSSSNLNKDHSNTSLVGYLFS